MLLTIEITPEQHRKLEAMAELQNKTVHEYLLDSAFPEMDDGKAISMLKEHLKPSLDAAKRGEFSKKTVDDIVTEVLNEKRSKQYQNAV